MFRNVTHGTSAKNAESIKKNGFRLPKRGSLYFDAKGKKGNLASVYGSDIIITVDLNARNVIKMSDVRAKIFPEMKSNGIVHTEENTHKFLRQNGYDLIDNGNELVVLDPKIITIKGFEKIN